MKKLATLILSSVALSANAQISTSNSSSVQEFSETTLVPYSVKFESSGGRLKRIECYTGRGCFTKDKNPEQVASHGFFSGRTALANPPPNPNVTMWMSFTLKGRNIFGNSTILDHLPIFARAIMKDMNTAPVIDGLGLAIYNVNGKAWNPNINCIQPSTYPQALCTSGIRVETCAPTAKILHNGVLRPIGELYGALPAMSVIKQDGVAYNPYPYSVPAQYLLNDVEYTFTMHAPPTFVVGDIVAPSPTNSKFSFRGDKPAEYGDFQWNNTGFVFALICSDAPYGSCEAYKNQEFSLEIKNISMGWF